MTRLLFIKLLRDLRSTGGRIAMMIIAICLSLIVFSAMLYARTLVQSNMTDGYMSTNPASARITFDPGIPPDQIETVRNLALAEPGVIDATARAVAGLKIQKDGDDSTLLQLFIAAPDDPMRIAKFEVVEGSWPPAPGSVLIERSALKALGQKVGDEITVTGFDGKPKQLKIAGTVRDQSLAPAGEATAYGYVTTDSLSLLGRPPTLNQLAITVADKPGQTEPSQNRDAIVSTASSVAEKLKDARNVEVEQVAVPPPYTHPHQDIANTILTALMAFGGLSLLLSAILIATMFNGLLTQHIPQIGIMKAIGARSSRILQLYGAMVLFIVATATALALIPGVALGRALAEMLLVGALNIDITSLAIPLWTFGVTIAAGIVVPVLIALVPLVRASRRTVREALDDRGVTDSQGRTATRFYAWLGKLRGVDRILLMAFRNVFRRRARFLLSVSLLAVAGAIFISGLNVMAGFQAIPKAITNEQRWDVQVKLAAPADEAKLTNIVNDIPGVATVETWDAAAIGVQYAGQLNVTRTYPDQGHGSLNLSAIPPSSTTINPPPVLEGRWLTADDTDAVVMPESIRNTLPDIKVGDSIELSIDDRFSTWRVVGIVQELTGGSCPCVTQAGFGQATGESGQSNVVRIITDSHDEQSRTEIAQTVAGALTDANIKVQNAQPIDAVLTSAEEHSGLLIILIMLIAFSIGVVGLIGLGSTMSTNVIERTREFGIMNAIGARASTVRRLVVFEGVFIAIVSCVVAVVPALILTAVLDSGLGNLFFNAPIPFTISMQAVVGWIALVTIGTVLATLAPAYRASRLTVREALSYL